MAPFVARTASDNGALLLVPPLARSLVIHALTRLIAFKSRTDVASGGICPGPRVEILVSSTEFVGDPGTITRAFGFPKSLISGPLIRPEVIVEFVMSALQKPCPAPAA